MEILMKKVNVARKRRIFNDFFKVDEAYLSYQQLDGQMSQVFRQLVFERGDSVAVLLWNKDTEQVILIKQFRYATYEKGPGWIIETIAGKLEENEIPEEAMRREVLEEVGYKVDELTYISTFYVSPGGTSERIILYYAEVSNIDKVAQGGGLIAEHEDIEIVEYTLPDLWIMLSMGHIVDAKTLIAIQWLKNKACQ